MIVIEISGRNVARVISDDPLTKVIIRDFDNIEEGDSDPCEDMDLSNFKEIA
jgi:hypothetical protein